MKDCKLPIGQRAHSRVPGLDLAGQLFTSAATAADQRSDIRTMPAVHSALAIIHIITAMLCAWPSG